ncbi:FtsL-like putative cell division protein [Flavobacteriales bacterium]|nr:S-adenosyl-methyltransferase [Flavobacteriales bacterium]MDB2317225.1 FtsL-like putative cell division protein [Flavobacteriales bacterium]
MIKPTWNKLFGEFGSRCKDFYATQLAPKNILATSWNMVLFISFLAILLVYSSHRVDRKVMRISKLNEELKDLRSRHIDMRTRLTALSKPTKVAEEVKSLGLSTSIEAPFKIEIKN